MMYKCQRINNPFIVKEPQKKKTSEKKHCIKDAAEKKGNEMERKGGKNSDAMLTASCDSQCRFCDAKR